MDSSYFGVDGDRKMKQQRNELFGGEEVREAYDNFLLSALSLPPTEEEAETIIRSMIEKRDELESAGRHDLVGLCDMVKEITINSQLDFLMRNANILYKFSRSYPHLIRWNELEKEITVIQNYWRTKTPDNTSVEKRYILDDLLHSYHFYRKNHDLERFENSVVFVIKNPSVLNDGTGDILKKLFDLATRIWNDENEEPVEVHIPLSASVYRIKVIRWFVEIVKASEHWIIDPVRSMGDDFNANPLFHDISSADITEFLSMLNGYDTQTKVQDPRNYPFDDYTRHKPLSSRLDEWEERSRGRQETIYERRVVLETLEDVL